MILFMQLATLRRDFYNISLRVAKFLIELKYYSNNVL